MSMTEKLDQVETLLETLKRDYPTETDAFLNFTQKAEGGPALDVRIKELINVALSVAGQCEWCIAFHVKHALEAGATRDEIMCAGFMAVIMHGGPALMYLTLLTDALNEMAPKA